MFRELVTEALDKNNTIARSIVRKMDHANWKNISEMDEMNYNYIANLCSGLSQKFDEASDEDKKEIVNKVYSKIHTPKSDDVVTEEDTSMVKSELKKRILDFVQKNGAIIYPLEQKAEELAEFLSNEKNTEDENCVEENVKSESKNNKKDSKFLATLKKDLKKSLGGAGTLIGGPVLGGIGQVVSHYISDSNEENEENILSEATMSDIPHEIDDQIHTLKDMRFDIEETEKNWDLAGMDTKPMDNIKNSINDLIEIMYQNGAELADQEIAKSIPNKEDDDSKESSIEKKDNL